MVSSSEPSARRMSPSHACGRVPVRADKSNLRLPGACGPSRDGASTRCARSWSPCERETRECGADGADSVDTYVSSKILRKLKNFATREPTILMGVAQACQRTPAYATFALPFATRKRRGQCVWYLVSSQSFPHLCKNLWKLVFFCVRNRKNSIIMDVFSRRKSAEHDLKPLLTVH